MLRPTLLLLPLLLPGCVKNASQMFEIGDATGDLEHWPHANMIVCNGSQENGTFGLVGESVDGTADGHDAYIIAFSFPWPAVIGEDVDVGVSVYVTTVADAASGGYGSATINLGPILEESVGNEPERIKWRELRIPHLEFPAQTLPGFYGPMDLYASTLDDGFFYCEDDDASLENLDSYYR